MHLNVQEEGKRVFLHLATFKMKCGGPLGRILEAKMGPSGAQIRAKRGQKGVQISTFRGPRQRGFRTRGPRHQNRGSKLVENRRHRGEARKSVYFVAAAYGRQRA